MDLILGIICIVLIFIGGFIAGWFSDQIWADKDEYEVEDEKCIWEKLDENYYETSCGSEIFMEYDKYSKCSICPICKCEIKMYKS